MAVFFRGLWDFGTSGLRDFETSRLWDIAGDARIFRRRVASSSCSLVVSLSRCLVVSRSCCLVGALLSHSQAFSVFLSHSQPIARHLVVSSSRSPEVSLRSRRASPADACIEAYSLKNNEGIQPCREKCSNVQKQKRRPKKVV